MAVPARRKSSTRIKKGRGPKNLGNGSKVSEARLKDLEKTSSDKSF
ncbi:3859_t:CDS:2 [Gigaspora margarita]|uniref:3859_t:CDS:1 n=1 Tax=Gigaspora margarita TaxID=4874 RepID=A0ABN7UYI4_GIGMA|nr:3859_t:CDS:2 [Gigaspora margarita]